MLNYKKNHSFAFTLAETLIVMGIIGVVAALTIPNLTQSTGEKEKVAKLQKLYSNLNDAYGRATAVYGPIDEWTGGNSNINIRLADRMLEFMKVTKNCGTTANNGCFTTGNSKALDGGSLSNIGGLTLPKVILADGASAYFSYVSSDPTCDTDFSDKSVDSPYKNVCAEVTVDIDGPNKGPYTWGKDIFVFSITKTGLYPDGGKSSGFSATDADLKGNCFTIGECCTGWVIETGNLDYLKATNGTCPNGTTLNWTNTSCK